MSELEIRQADLRPSQDEDGVVEGIAVPWDTPTSIAGMFTETIARGAVVPGPIKLFWQHRDVVGKVIATEDRDEGFWIKAKVSDTTAGRDALTLLRDGVVDRFSIGFEPLEDSTDEHGNVVRTKIRVREVSAVPFPAYEDAVITQVREQAGETKEETMPDSITRADLDEVRSTIEDIDREVRVLAANVTERTEPAGDLTRSFGEFVQRIVAGDEAVTRAYTGTVSGDAVLQDAWVGNLVDILHQRQTVASTFQRGTLPSTGLSVEYAVLESDTTQVGVQAAEGDDLDFGKVAIETKTAPVVTLGGWTSLSRQAIERTSNVSILDTAFRAMAEKYGRAVEARARAALNSAITAADSIEGDLTTQTGIVTALLELAEHFDTNGLSLDGLFVSRDVFLGLYGVDSTDRVLQVTGAPTDKVGTVSVNSLSGNVAGVPVRVLPGATAGTVAAYDATAIRTLESAGAPIRLQDENVINLSKDFSVYGYVASFVQRPDGIVTVTEGA